MSTFHVELLFSCITFDGAAEKLHHFLMSVRTAGVYVNASSPVLLPPTPSLPPPPPSGHIRCLKSLPHVFTLCRTWKSQHCFNDALFVSLTSTHRSAAGKLFFSSRVSPLASGTKSIHTDWCFDSKTGRPNLKVPYFTVSNFKNSWPEHCIQTCFSFIIFSFPHHICQSVLF